MMPQLFQAKQFQAKQQGFSLILVVFILVVLGLLGTVMLRMLAVSADSVAREVLSTRALHAADSGAQRKLNEIFSSGGGPAVCTDATEPYPFPVMTGCADVQVQCTTITLASNYYTITSTGTCGPTGEAAVRRIQVQAKDV